MLIELLKWIYAGCIALCLSSSVAGVSINHVQKNYNMIYIISLTYQIIFCNTKICPIIIYIGHIDR